MRCDAQRDESERKLQEQQDRDDKKHDEDIDLLKKIETNVRVVAPSSVVAARDSEKETREVSCCNCVNFHVHFSNSKLLVFFTCRRCSKFRYECIICKLCIQLHALSRTMSTLVYQYQLRCPAFVPIRVYLIRMHVRALYAYRK